MEQQIQALEEQIRDLENNALTASNRPQLLVKTLRYNKPSGSYVVSFYFISSLLDNVSVIGEKKLISMLGNVK